MFLPNWSKRFRNMGLHWSSCVDEAVRPKFFSISLRPAARPHHDLLPARLVSRRGDPRQKLLVAAPNLRPLRPRERRAVARVQRRLEIPEREPYPRQMIERRRVPWIERD